MWQNKCNDLQMLKFGRLIDLDVLENGGDRSKENEAEGVVRGLEEEFMHSSSKLAREIQEAKDQLAEATKTNTLLLETVGTLTDKKIVLTKELNKPSEALNTAASLEDFRDSEEKRKLAVFVQLQNREIETLKSEITMLRRKETPQFSTFLPAPPQSNDGRDTLVLPPITTAKSGSAKKPIARLNSR